MTQTHHILDRRTFLAGALAFSATVLADPMRAFAEEDIDYNALKAQEEAEANSPSSDSNSENLTDEEAAEKLAEQERQAQEAAQQEADAAEEAAEEAIAEAKQVTDQILALQDQLAKSASDYYKALDEYDACANAVNEAQAALDHADEDIAALQNTLAERARSMYRDGQSSDLDLVLGSASFEEFALNWSVLSILNEEDQKRIEEIRELKAKVEALQGGLTNDQEKASVYLAEAEAIKNANQSAIAELEALLAEMNADVERLVEEAQLKRAQVNYEASRKSYSYTGSSTLSIPSQGGVVDYALSRIGCPYVWGAEGPDTFDCSGLVRWAYLQIGISLPHQTEALYHAAAARLEVSEARPGDVLWVGYGDGYNGHVGIALTNGGTRYVHAPTFGARVRDTDPLEWAGFTHCLRFI